MPLVTKSVLKQEYRIDGILAYIFYRVLDFDQIIKKSTNLSQQYVFSCLWNEISDLLSNCFNLRSVSVALTRKRYKEEVLSI